MPNQAGRPSLRGRDRRDDHDATAMNTAVATAARGRRHPPGAVARSRRPARRSGDGGVRRSPAGYVATEVGAPRDVGGRSDAFFRAASVP